MESEKFTLILGDKSISSWSLRGWLIMKHVGIPFEEVLVNLYREDTKDNLKELSPSLLVPCLHHGDLVIWDTLSIAEYINELYPEKGLWPQERKKRAYARSVVAEMHSSFTHVRDLWSFDIVRNKTVELDPVGDKEILRIFNVWAECRSRYTKDGPFLLGQYSLADIFYAPIISRFKTYGLNDIPDFAIDYMDTIWDLPLIQEWIIDAQKEID